MLFMSFLPLSSPPDALLADLENTGSPLARCPVLLTSDPPQDAEAEPPESEENRPPPPAYTPQQVHKQEVIRFLISDSDLNYGNVVLRL